MMRNGGDGRSCPGGPSSSAEGRSWWRTGRLLLRAARAAPGAAAAVPNARRATACAFVCRFAVACAAVLVLMFAGAGCAVSQAVADAASTTAPAHRVHVVFHGWHSGIAVRAADVPPQAWPARRDFPQAEFLEVGWGDRAYYMAADPSVWLGLRALLWPTPGVLHVVAFDGPPERRFPPAGVVELELNAPGFASLVASVRDSHERVPSPPGRPPSAPPGGDADDWPPPLGPGLYRNSLFYASRERFHLFKTCNVWTASVLAAAGVPLRPASALTAGALFAQLRPLGRVLQAPP